MVRRLILHGSHFGFIKTLSIWAAEITLCLSRTKMSSSAADTPMATPAKSPKRRIGSKKGTSGSSISSLILKAVAASGDRGGLSLAGLKKALKAGGYDVDKKNGRILVAIKRLVAKKSLVRTKGSGASGSFRLNKKPPTPRKKKNVRKKKTSVKKVRKTKKTATGTASATPKKSPKKKKAKSAKKPKKPAAAKRPKKAPKKINRKAAKTTRTRRATPKK